MSDLINQRKGNPQAGGYGRSFLSIAEANFDSEHGGVIELSASAVFSVPIQNVFMVCPAKPMGRVVAEPVVASMQHMQGKRVFAMNDQPTDANRLQIQLVQSDFPALFLGAFIRGRSFPGPASIGAGGLIHFFPKLSLLLLGQLKRNWCKLKSWHLGALQLAQVLALATLKRCGAFSILQQE